MKFFLENKTRKQQLANCLIFFTTFFCIIGFLAIGPAMMQASVDQTQAFPEEYNDRIDCNITKVIVVAHTNDVFAGANADVEYVYGINNQIASDVTHPKPDETNDDFKDRIFQTYKLGSTHRCYRKGPDDPVYLFIPDYRQASLYIHGYIVTIVISILCGIVICRLLYGLLTMKKVRDQTENTQNIKMTQTQNTPEETI